MVRENQTPAIDINIKSAIFYFHHQTRKRDRITSFQGSGTSIRCKLQSIDYNWDLCPTNALLRPQFINPAQKKKSIGFHYLQPAGCLPCGVKFPSLRPLWTNWISFFTVFISVGINFTQTHTHTQTERLFITTNELPDTVLCVCGHFAFIKDLHILGTLFM